MSNRSVPWLMFLPPLVFLALAVLFYAGMQRENPRDLPSALIGRDAPVTVLEPLGDNPPIDAAALASGEVAIVNFWASWCAPCRVEHPVLTEMAADMPVYGINYKDRPVPALEFLIELGNPFAAAGSDPEGRYAQEWGVYGVPETFVISAEGKILYRHPGQLTKRLWEERIRPAIEAGQDG